MNPSSNLPKDIKPLDLSLAIDRGTAKPSSKVRPSEYDKQLNDVKDGSDSQPSVSQEKFASIIMDVGNRIPNPRLEDVKFLCHDKVTDQAVLENAKSATDILSDMSTYGTLDKTNVGLVAELLHRIGMVKPKREVFEGTAINWPTVDGVSFLDPFRCLLHAVIQQLPKKKLTDLKDYCLIRSVASGQELDETDNLLDFFKLLEDEDEIAPDNIGLLKDFSEQVLKNKKVKNYIEAYEKERMEQGQPVLAMTVEESNKLLTITAISKEGSIDLKKFYGSYGSISTSKANSPVDSNISDQPFATDSKKPKRRPMITPSMLSNPISQPESTLQNSEVGKTDDADRVKDGKDSPEPMEADQNMRQLKSRDFPSDNTFSNAEEDPTEWFTHQDDYQTHMQLKLKISCYRMDANPKGICFILSNEHFDRKPGQTEPSDREGTEEDVKNLKSIFRKLRFEVEIARNLTAEEIRQKMKELKSRDHSRYNAFICCILSHGNKGIVLGKDGIPVELAKIIGYFKGRDCPTLIDKPKVFIVQACQGDNWQAVTTETAPQSPTRQTAGMGSSMEMLPNEVDLCLLLSTIPGYKSARSKEKGSWFIMALTHILSKYPDCEMQSIMTLINKELAKATKAKQENRWIAQTALPSHTLRKLLFLQRPEHIQQSLAVRTDEVCTAVKVRAV